MLPTNLKNSLTHHIQFFKGNGELDMVGPVFCMVNHVSRTTNAELVDIFTAILHKTLLEQYILVIARGEQC